MMRVEVDILVKALSYDEVTNMFKGEDPEKITVADVLSDVYCSLFTIWTQKSLCIQTLKQWKS